MVLIFSLSYEPSTNYVIDWLHQHRIEWKRINHIYADDGISQSFEISSDKKELQLKIGNDNILDKATSVWFRRFDISSELKVSSQIDVNLIGELKSNFQTEKRSFYETIDRNILTKKRLSKLSSSHVSKIVQLEVAKEVNLTIPPSLITTSKKDLTLFFNKYKKCIIKPIEFTPNIVFNNKSFVPFTTLLTKEYIDNLDETFYPTLCQEHVEKDFEIRSFFIDGKFYSMALFSQDNEKTSVDSRNYDDEKPTRRLPYKLPKDVEKKLKLFCKKLQINCGSFDLIKNKNGEFYFLEINPLGQFGFVSVPCNYNLYEKIALYLANPN